MSREATNKILEMIDEQVLDPKDVVMMCLKWMSEDDVKEMAKANEIELNSKVNDYIIHVGHSKEDLNPFDSAHTPQEAVDKAKEYTEDWEYIEIVYMPVDDDDINEVVWTWHSGL